MRRAGELPLDDAPDLGQLVHQICLACAADRPCRRSARPLPRAVAALTASKTTAAGSEPAAWRITSTPMRPPQTLELLDRRGAERVGRRQEHLLARALERWHASFATSSSCPEPFTPSRARRPAGDRDRVGWADGRQRLDEEAPEERPELVGSGHRSEHHLLARAIDEIGGQRRSEIRGDQQLLELLEQGIVDGSISARARSPRPPVR